MSRPDRAYAFVEFIVRDEAALDRLATVAEEFQRQKQGEAIAEEGYWLPYFDEPDRVEFWWPTEPEAEAWYACWSSTPLPDRHSPEMPSPPWVFGSMIDAILCGEYDVVGIRRLDAGRARFEIDPFAYPYGGIDAVRALVRSFGHRSVGFDNGTGFVAGDPRLPRWRIDGPPLKPEP